jgi:hypothetical protein
METFSCFLEAGDKQSTNARGQTKYEKLLNSAQEHIKQFIEAGVKEVKEIKEVN